MRFCRSPRRKARCAGLWITVLRCRGEHDHYDACGAIAAPFSEHCQWHLDLLTKWHNAGVPHQRETLPVNLQS